MWRLATDGARAKRDGGGVGVLGCVLEGREGSKVGGDGMGGKGGG